MARANDLIRTKEYDNARALLADKTFNVLELEIERLYLIAQTYMAENKPDEAITIYRHILDNQPQLSKIRAELAIAYMMTGDWYRADYHMRLALSDRAIPESAAAQLKQMLFVIRKNKNWDAWFNFSAAPDSNPAQTRGGEECLGIFGLVLCHQIPEPQPAFGFHIGTGGNYEYKLSDRWGIKSELAVFTSLYDVKKYNDVYLAAGIGPRYVWMSGEAFLAATAVRRWYGGTGYNRSFGLKLDLRQDLSDTVGTALMMQYSPSHYDEYGDILNGSVYSAAPKLIWIISSSMFVDFTLRAERESTRDPAYSNNKFGFSHGFGTELPYGFRIHAQPFATWVRYDSPQWVIKNYALAEVIEKDFLWGGSVSISNNNLSIFDFTPTLVYRYVSRDSNIWQREFSKHSIEMQIQKKF
jgi:tetratricopeptide (TPR) repeat protein